MTAQVGCAPTWPIDGPPPQPRPFGILSVARVIDDLDEQGVERFANGVEVYPFPAGPANAWDANASGSLFVSKEAGDPVDLPVFGPLTVYLGETCSSVGIFGRGISNEEAQDRFVARAEAALAAVEGAAYEREFMDGAILGGNPHLADGNADVLTTGTTSPMNGLALLENAIGETGKAGVIHVSPGLVVSLSDRNLIRVVDRGGAGTPQLQTFNGTPIVAGAGYVGVSTPDGESAATGTVEYIYATGPIEIRRTPVIVLPSELSQALVRGTNLVEYVVERYAVVDWDVQLQAVAKVDRCQVACS
jgi:hypothetical protein